MYHGDIAEDATIRFAFNTNDADRAPITLAGTPAISIYKDGDTTQTTAGVTLTVDFDGLTGYHVVTVDTSADAFYAVGGNYRAVITTGTVDGTSVVGSVVGHFSIQNRVVASVVGPVGSVTGAVGSVTAGVTLADDAITAGKFDESTAFPQTAAYTAPLTASGVRTAIGLASANLDTQLADLPTVAEFEARTLAAAAYFDPATDQVTPTTASKSGYSLSATGLDSITATDPGGVASTFPQMGVQLWRRFFKKTTLTTTQLKTYADDGTTVNTTQTVSDDGTTQTQGDAS